MADSLLFTDQNAVISADQRYRYILSRAWDRDKPVITWIMLNPSTADASTDDPTIRRCVGFARRWGAGEIIVVNLFAWRATDPSELSTVARDPVGPENRDYVEHACLVAHDSGGEVICGWGTRGRYLDQDVTTLGWLDNLMITPRCLGLTASGDPRHPLYMPGNSPLLRFVGRA